MTSTRSESCLTRIDKTCLAVGRLGFGRILVVCGYMYCTWVHRRLSSSDVSWWLELQHWPEKHGSAPPHKDVGDM